MCLAVTLSLKDIEVQNSYFAVNQTKNSVVSQLCLLIPVILIDVVLSSELYYSNVTDKRSRNFFSVVAFAWCALMFFFFFFFNVT